VPSQTLPVGTLGQGGVTGEGGPARAVRVQAVVDGQGQDAATILTAPVGRQLQQGERVATAGQAERYGPVDLPIESGAQAIENAAEGDGPIVWRGQAQSASVRTRAATLRRSCEARAL
jgi:hypothetical protein